MDHVGGVGHRRRLAVRPARGDGSNARVGIAHGDRAHHRSGTVALRLAAPTDQRLPTVRGCASSSRWPHTSVASATVLAGYVTGRLTALATAARVVFVTVQAFACSRRSCRAHLVPRRGLVLISTGVLADAAVDEGGSEEVRSCPHPPAPAPAPAAWHADAAPP